MVHSNALETSLAMPDDDAQRQEVITQQISVAKTVLLQAIDLLDNYLTSDDQMTIHSKYLPGSTIGRSSTILRSVRVFSVNLSTHNSLGKHLRHARDHYTLLFDCMAQPPPRTLSYDTRIRNTPMETSREGAKSALLETIQQLNRSVPSVSFDETITLQAVTPHLHTFSTTVGREVKIDRTFFTYSYIDTLIGLVCHSSLRTSLVYGKD